MEKISQKDSARFMASLLSILSIIFVKEFIELTVNTDAMIKNVNFAELNIFTVAAFFKKKTLKMI